MKTLQELKAYLATRPDTPEEYKIAVGALMFTPDDKIILLERGAGARDSRGKLEGIGGGLDAGEEDLHEVLRREIREEIGDVQVSIGKMLTVKIIPGEHDPWWVVVDYLCRLEGGTPKNMEPQKCVAMHYLALKDIDTSKLSPFQLVTMNEYKKQYGNKPFYK